MPQVQTLFDKRFQAMQRDCVRNSESTNLPVHPLYTEATTRLAERLADVARDFARVGEWESGQSQEMRHPASPRLRRTSCESISPPSLRGGDFADAAIQPPTLRTHPQSFIWTGLPRPQEGARNDGSFGGSTSHDLITSCLTLQNANDLQGELAAIREALTQGGLFLGVLAGGQSFHEMRTSLMEAEIALTGGASPRTHPLPDLETMGRLLGAARFALPVVDVERLTLAYPDLATVMRDLRAYACTNALTERSRRFAPRALFTKTQEIYAARFPAPSGGIAVTVELVFLHGWRE